MFCQISFGIVCLLLATDSFAVKLTPVIHTEKGPIRGAVLKTLWKKLEYYSFKGIRYAEPPTGKHRFKPPVEAKPWNTTFEALEEGNKCPQFDFWYDNFTGNEDCLFLNVYTPQTSKKELKPVMVWIYGGSFKSGYKNSILYGPDFFLNEDVVVVALNYRLGALGFLALDHPDALGNTGLKDQNLALQWVKQNIRYFGGDSNKVTIVGQSAGGASVDMHVLSEKSRGLFQRSITMSASVLCSWAFMLPSKGIERAFQLGALLGHSTSSKDDLLKFLQKASAYDLVVATSNLTLVDPPFKPTLENPSLAPKKDIFLSKCVVDKYNNGKYRRLPHMMGFTQDETLSFSKPVVNVLEVFNDSISSITNIGDFFKTAAQKSWLSPLENGIQNISDIAFYELVKVTTDVIFKAPIDVKQKFLSKENDHPIYYYDLAYNSQYALHRTKYDIEFNGTGHGDDFGFLFHTAIEKKIPIDPKNPFNVFRRKIVRLWSNFIKYANPTPRGENDTSLNVIWPDSRDDGEQLLINDTLKVEKRQIREETQLYEVAVKFSAPIFTGCKL